MKKINLSKNVISIDVESNGLWGDPFMIAAVVYHNGTEIERQTWRCPINGEISPWVRDNVLPQLEGVKENCESLNKMLKSFGSWWLSHKKGYEALWHMGHVVEAGLFRSLVEKKFIGEWDAPYTPIELATLLATAGYPADSVDSYLKNRGIKIEGVPGGTHNALYDALAAAKAYYLLLEELK
jgi:hypothetical protein